MLGRRACVYRTLLASQVMFSAMLQQHVCVWFYVVLAEVSGVVSYSVSNATSTRFSVQDSSYVASTEPGLFVGSHLSSQIPYQISSEPTGHVQIRSQRHGSRLLMSGIRTEFMA